MKEPSYLTRTLPALLLALSLAACDSGGDDGLSLSGTVVAPAGIGDDVSFRVTACPPLDAIPGGKWCDFDSFESRSTVVESNNGRASFQLSDLPGERYLLRAWDRTTGSIFSGFSALDCNADNGDVCRYFEASSDNLELTLEPIEQDFRIIVTGPSGFDLTGSEVAFCFPDPENDEICVAESSFGPYPVFEDDEQEGTFGVQIWRFPAERYALFAGKDLSGDGVWDFWQCYNGDFDNLCDEVLPGTGQDFDIRIVDAGDQTPPCPYGPCPAALTADERRSAHKAGDYGRNALTKGDQPEMALPLGF